ncbi:MAG TPA: ABC transporter permease, partial [Chloroflexota bacterium]|nr:ABC transporter permease [Chloroflexota bacterium]
MPPVWTFTRLTLREAWRSKLLALAFGLTLLYIGLVAWGVSKLVEHSRNPLNTLASSAALEVLAFFLGSFMVTLLAVFVAGHSTRQEAESGLLQAILTKPIRRFDVVAGRWLGSAMLLAAYVALFSAGVVAAVGLQVGY